MWCQHQGICYNKGAVAGVMLQDHLDPGAQDLDNWLENKGHCVVGEVGHGERICHQTSWHILTLGD